MPLKVTADGGFASKDNLAFAKRHGVKDAVFAKKRGLSVLAMAKSAWVYRALRNFRAGIEAGISTLKRAFGLDRCTWKVAERVMAVLPKRFEKYGLTLHPEKTRLVHFKRPSAQGVTSGEPTTFNFLGFMHYWMKSINGYWVIKRKTATDRFNRSLKRLNQWLREVMHHPVSEQHKALCVKIRGHIQYYGIIGNSEAVGDFVYWVGRCWKKWLCRRSHSSNRTWEWFNALVERFPLPVAKIIHSC
jgi:IS5 family transposase